MSPVSESRHLAVIVEVEAIREVKKHVVGARWDDWTASSKPILLIRGADSRVISAEHAIEIVRRRPNTQLAVIDGAGHDFYISHPDEFATRVEQFLEQVA
jgi:pimeloyl-ACP methyl ester carboxylesterase